ncbi:MAG: phosphotransferase system, enzyme PtsI [Pseudomonadota bacterium]
MAKQCDGMGRPVSGGVGFGPAHCHETSSTTEMDTLFQDDQRLRLDHAISVARRGLIDLASLHEETSADILEFQIEMLEDPSLLVVIEQHLDAGWSAIAAWNAAFTELFHSFSSSEDLDLQARAVDILDLKNRGLRAFGGVSERDFPAGSIFVADDMEPSAFLAHDWSKGGGILLKSGSEASHVAILARARSIPMIVKADTVSVSPGDYIEIDGLTGSYSSRKAPNGNMPETPVQSLRLGLANRKRNPGFRLFANISDPEECQQDRLSGLDGIGLVRTEFLLRNDLDLFDEARQIEIYSKIVEMADGKSVTFRLFDFGFDKPFPGLQARKDTSPLGLRGIRLLLKHPDVLQVQIRAILLASRKGPVQIMVPMVTVPSEMTHIRMTILAEWEILQLQNTGMALPPIGMMVEVPAAALMVDLFEHADFFSYGTNDLAQYLMAADRHNSDVADLHAYSRAPVMRLLSQSVALARKTGKRFSICGDMAADEEALSELIALGFTAFSVALDRVEAIDTLLSTRDVSIKTGVEA